MPVSVATPRCGIWLTVFCDVLAADRRFSPFRLLRCAQNRGQRARHTGVVGLKDSSETQKRLFTTGGLPGGKMPTTGSTTIGDIGQPSSSLLGRATREPRARAIRNPRLYRRCLTTLTS